MNTRRNNKPMSKGHRVLMAPPSSRYSVIEHATATGRAVVIETVHTAQDIIRVSIEPAVSRPSERVIAF
jgi:hypothetical protein